MPARPKTICTHPGCGRLVDGPGKCDTHQAVDAQRRRDGDRMRGTASQRGYDHNWSKARTAYLHAHPLCVQCGSTGRIVPAKVVDHIIPHRGDQTLFWDENNWQALCFGCHSRKTAAEDGGFGNAIKSL